MSSATSISRGFALLVLVLLMSAAALAQWAVDPFPRNEVITIARPEIGANFPFRVHQESARLYVDGRDVTALARVDPRRISWRPPYDLDQGVHRVRVTATLIDESTLDNTWTFTLASGPSAPPSVFALASQVPASGALTGLRPSIGAYFQGQLSQAQLWVDGIEVSGLAQRGPSSFVWTPSYDLDYGRHQVRMRAFGQQGQEVNSDWYFVVEHP